MQRAPGRTLLALARRVLSRAEIDRVIEPTLADLQHEWSATAGAPPVERFAIRARAYVAAVLVVVRHLLGSTVREGLTPPPWPIVRQVLLSSLLFVVSIAAIQAFIASPRDMEEPWLLRTTDTLLGFGAFSPYMWVYLFDRRVLAQRGIPEPRATDIAKLTAVLCIGLVAWTGWIAPLARQQYLAGLSLGATITAGPHQWMLPDLVWAILGAPRPDLIIELHQRLLLVAFTPIAGMLCWSTIRRSRRRPIGVAAGFQLLSFSILGAIFLSFSLACSNAFGRVAADWLGVLAATIGALGVLWIVRVGERSAHLAEIDA